MKIHHTNWTIIVLFTIIFITLPTVFAGDKTDVSKVPKPVMDGLSAKFPMAEIHKWTVEKEGGKVIYDFEFKFNGMNYEADIKEDGTIHNWEKAISDTDLPQAIRKVMYGKYPKATFKEVLEIKNGMDVIEGYEVVFISADKTEMELLFAPDGKIIDEGDEDGEEDKDEELE